MGGYAPQSCFYDGASAKVLLPPQSYLILAGVFDVLRPFGHSNLSNKGS